MTEGTPSYVLEDFILALRKRSGFVITGGCLDRARNDLLLHTHSAITDFILQIHDEDRFKFLDSNPWGEDPAVMIDAYIADAAPRRIYLAFRRRKNWEIKSFHWDDRNRGPAKDEEKM